MLTKLKHYVPGHILRSLYCTLILPYTNYGILVWGNTCKTYLEKILKLQKWAIRTISHEHYRCHTGPLFKKHKILTVQDAFKLELGIFMYKHQTKQLPEIFVNYFRKHNQIHSYQTRNSENYSIYNAKKMYADRAIRITGPILWNSLNMKLKEAKTIKQFRSTMKTTLLDLYN